MKTFPMFLKVEGRKESRMTAHANAAATVTHVRGCETESD